MGGLSQGYLNSDILNHFLKSEYTYCPSLLFTEIYKHSRRRTSAQRSRRSAAGERGARSPPSAPPWGPPTQEALSYGGLKQRDKAKPTNVRAFASWLWKLSFKYELWGPPTSPGEEGGRRENGSRRGARARLARAGDTAQGVAVVRVLSSVLGWSWGKATGRQLTFFQENTENPFLGSKVLSHYYLHRMMLHLQIFILFLTFQVTHSIQATTIHMDTQKPCFLCNHTRPWQPMRSPRARSRVWPGRPFPARHEPSCCSSEHLADGPTARPAPRRLFLTACKNCSPVLRGFLLPKQSSTVCYPRNNIFSKQFLNSNLVFKLKTGVDKEKKNEHNLTGVCAFMYLCSFFLISFSSNLALRFT